MASSPDAASSPDISPPAPLEDEAAAAAAVAPPPANPSASPPPPETSPSDPPPSPPLPPPPSSPPPQPPSSPPPPSPLQSPPPSQSPPADAPPPQSSSPPPSPPANASTPPATTAPPPPSSTPPSQEGWSPPPPISRDAPPAPLPATPPTRTFTPPPPPRTGGLSPPSPRTPSNPSPSRNTPPPPLNNDNSGPNLPLILGLTAGVGLFIVLMLLALVLCVKKKKKKPPPPPPNGGFYQAGPLPKWHNGGQGMEHGGGNLPPPPGAWGQSPPPPMMSSGEMSSSYTSPHGIAPSPTSPGLGFSKSSFNYDELASATKGFSSDNLLGQGGFGYVYKGVLPSGQEVAVKQLKSGSGQGEREFQAEVEIISRVHHRHLVSLVGYCITGAQRMLVYEFVPNNTLEHHLHGKGVPTIDWHTRLKIAIGSAKGLAYLHEDCHPRIIHRDIKTANILVDNNFEAMVADFGLAKFTSDTNTHVSTRIMGTFGYLAPEYASTGKLTEKSDVFSFGVILLELLTGRRPIDNYMEESLVDWTRPLLAQALADENFDELADPRLGKNYDAAEMARMAACAASCVRHSARRRPKMSQIVRALDGDASIEDLNEGVKPGQSAIFSSSSEHEQGTYSSKMREFRKAAFGSYDYSNDFSVATSEYGLNPSESSSSGEVSSVGSRREMPPPHHNL